jgi:hypothetical protein
MTEQAIKEAFKHVDQGETIILDATLEKDPSKSH